jgi:hypothetical protein
VKNTSRRLGFLTFALLLIGALQAQVLGEPVREIRTGKAEVISLAISPKNDRLLVGLDKGAELIDLENGKKLFSLPYAEDGGTAVYYAGFNANGEYLVLIGHSGKRVVYSTTTGKQEPSLAQHRWVPDPRAVKAMGLSMDNSTFDRFYQQTEAHAGDLTIKAARNGSVECSDAEGHVLQRIDSPGNKDVHHLAPLLVHDGLLYVGQDDGRVLVYTAP